MMVTGDYLLNYDCDLLVYNALVSCNVCWSVNSETIRS